MKLIDRLLGREKAPVPPIVVPTGPECPCPHCEQAFEAGRQRGLAEATQETQSG